MSANRPSPVRIQPMLTCARLLELWYQEVIFAGDESLGPSKSNADPTTTSTTNTSPLRLDQSRKPRLAIPTPPIDECQIPAPRLSRSAAGFCTAGLCLSSASAIQGE